MKKTYRKVKQFVKDHEDALYIGTIIVGTTATAIAVAFVADHEVKAQKELDEWTRVQNFRGKTVYKLDEGSYIAVSADQVS